MAAATNQAEKIRRPEQYSDEEFYARVPNEQAAYDLAVATLYPEGVNCPGCYGKAVTPEGIGDLPVTYRCDFCDKEFNVLDNTLLEGLEIAFQEILWAAFVFTSQPMFGSPKELASRMGWDEATASKVFFRFLMAADRPRPPLRGAAETDWTWLPCVDEHGDSQKVMVIGLMGRTSKTVAALAILPNEKMGAIGEFLFNEFLGPYLYTDSHLSNVGLRDLYAEYGIHPRIAQIVIQICNHSRRRFVEGPASTNLAEGFWSRLKRCLRRYDWLGDRSLTHCLKAFLWWDNVREWSHQERIDDLIRGCRGKQPKPIYDDIDFELQRKFRQLEIDLRHPVRPGSSG